MNRLSVTDDSGLFGNVESAENRTGRSAGAGFLPGRPAGEKGDKGMNRGNRLEGNLHRLRIGRDNGSDRLRIFAEVMLRLGDLPVTGMAGHIMVMDMVKRAEKEGVGQKSVEGEKRKDQKRFNTGIFLKPLHLASVTDPVLKNQYTRRILPRIRFFTRTGSKPESVFTRIKRRGSRPVIG